VLRSQAGSLPPDCNSPGSALLTAGPPGAEPPSDGGADIDTTGAFGLVVRFTVTPGHESAFDDLVAETVPRIAADEPGTLVYACHRVDGEPQARTFYELYRDRRAFEAHETAPHVRRFLAERAAHLDDVRVERLMLTAATGVPHAPVPPDASGATGTGAP
jgi:quinol monooxygenase YgiN